jgi:hypothetical protein
MNIEPSINEAKRILRAAGYYYLPMEKVLRVGVEIQVDHASMISYGSEAGYIQMVYHNIFVKLGHELAGKGICELSTVEDEKSMSTRYRAVVSVLPASIVSDPLLEMLREREQGIPQND